jgi:prevent-host-death family protein
MRNAYTVAEARERLATLLDEVEEGREVAITRRGKVVAVVLSEAALDALRGKAEGFAETYAAFLRVSDVERHGADAGAFAALRGSSRTGGRDR